MNALLDSSNSKNCMLVSKIKSLEDEHVCAKTYLPTSTSDKLACILSSQNPFGNKCGLGFDKVHLTQKLHLSTKGR